MKYLASKVVAVAFRTLIKTRSPTSSVSQIPLTLHAENAILETLGVAVRCI